ncbi:hypothetical protein ACBJ59_02910 [Nonomuraea sp. MTCD27]|uniref:hypothetical protein n=1 Tax=Nonomuraea sp. MTCD27 TaxID=1676747 RepID=UPI0035C0A76B
MGIDLIDREAWRARAPRGTYDRISRTRVAKIHYTGRRVDPATVDDHNLCIAAVRSIQKGHQDGSHGWLDIGCTAAVCTHRVVFAGRGPHILPVANGAGLNAGHYAVLGLVGNSGLTVPPYGVHLGLADSACGGVPVYWDRDFLGLALVIVSRLPGQAGFVVLHPRCESPDQRSL